VRVGVENTPLSPALSPKGEREKICPITPSPLTQLFKPS
jgi:hypothetical protein